MNAGRGRRTASSLAIAVALAAGCAGSPPEAPSESSADRPTFSRDVAPLVFGNCVPCHHEGGSGPFPLVSYEDVRRRARQIVDVTGSRIMPPWPPVPGHGRFKGERRLAPEQIAMLARWVEQGRAEGDPADLPPAPRFEGQWPLGTPDLVLTAPEPWILPADGGDVFRNFVLQVPLDGVRFVRAFDINPGNARIVHHANALVDSSGVSRGRDAAEPGGGFAGMDLEIASDRFDPDSQFLFWKPGTPPAARGREIPWTIAPGDDIVVNLHLRTSGKPEAVRPSVGVYFTDEEPAEFPMLLQLEHDGALDIPAGDRMFTVTDELQLPVAVRLTAVYPHAHYLGREVAGTVRLPDGTTEWLIHIDDWNLDWQAVYHLEEPLDLPAGAVLSMRWTYDNSAANDQNPHDPPRRVRAGNRASDEMSHLWVQVVPRRREDLALLQEAAMVARLRKYPGDFAASANLGFLRQSTGRLDEAIAYFREALSARPEDAVVRNSLGTALLASGAPEWAVAELHLVLRTAPDYLPAHYNLGNALLASGRPAEAVPHFERVLRERPDDAAALSDLGSALAMSGHYEDAVRAFERSLALRPENAFAHYNLGLIDARRGRFDAAAAHFRRALAIDPDDADVAAALRELRKR